MKPDPNFESEEEIKLSFGLSMINPTYTSTNESLESIVAGLDVQSEDKILGILGSGQQGLAILENGPKVDLIDYEEKQIKYFLELFNFIKNTKNSNKSCRNILYKISYDVNTKIYFSSVPRIKRIRKNISRLNVLPTQNIFELEKNLSKYNKVYLSNAIDYNSFEIEDQIERLEKFGSKFNSGTLFYISRRFYSGKIKGFCIEKDLTQKAKALKEKGRMTEWEPRVLIKN